MTIEKGTGTAERLRNRIAIVGVAESGLGDNAGRDALELQAEAARAALGEAGLGPADVDGVFAHTGGTYAPGLVAEYLGLRPSYLDGTNIGGTSNVSHVIHAAAAIAAGLCNVALITYGSTQRSDASRRLAGRDEDPRSPRGQYEAPHGMLAPLGHYAMVARRHMHQHGTTAEELAEVAVAARQWAALNPVARRRAPLSVAEVLDSPMVAEPLHVLDCCLVTDGGGALVVTSAERSRDLAQRPVLVAGMAEAANRHFFLAGDCDITTSDAAITGRRAMEMAGVGHADIDVAQIYDAFTIMVIISLEDLGFCRRGEGGAFVSGGRIAPGGDFPLNTSGGGLSYCHPGMFGVFLVIEAVRQLRGECGRRQVDGARTALCHATGLAFGTHATLVLAAET